MTVVRKLKTEPLALSCLNKLFDFRGFYNNNYKKNKKLMNECLKRAN